MSGNPRKHHFSSFQINTQLLFWKLLTKSPTPAILDDRKSLSIAFLAILDQCATLYFLIFYKMAAGGQLWMTENHFRAQFSPFQINTQLCSKWPPKSIRTYLYRRSVATSNMKLIAVFLIKLWSAQAFSSYFHKMAVGGHFGFLIFSKIDRVLPL